MNGEPIAFDWDRHNIAHIARHRVAPEEFEEALRNQPVFFGMDDESGEERWYVAGMTNGLRVLELVLTYRGDKIRAVTARDARPDVCEFYFKTVGFSR